MKTKIPFIPLFLFLFIIGCKEQPGEESSYDLGVAHLEVTGNEEAQQSFEKGLLLLHSFEYEDAREAFLEAQTSDPDMVMAYWGEALTYNHNLWSEQDFDAGRQALDKIERIIDADNYSALEKDLIAAANVLYEKGKEKSERDQAYADKMAELHERYPKNQEVAAFYSLSLLGSVEEGRNKEIYEKGATIAQGVLEENPHHPGALHYLIHSYDDPEHARLALDAAFSYGKVAPDASHALHMPSHIFVALGMWDEVVTFNERSYEASLKRMEKKNLDNDARGYHAFHWLEYGYLQQGRIEDAEQLVYDMEKYMLEKPSKRARNHMIFLKGTYLFETDDWESKVANISVDLEGLNVAIRSQYRFQAGMLAYYQQDMYRLDSLIEVINNDRENEAILASTDANTMCAGLTRATASSSNIKESMVMEYQLRGMKAALQKNIEEAENWLVKSVELEESLSYSYGPPFLQKPTRELYADWLLSHDRKEEALQQYEKALERGPNRTYVVSQMNRINAT